MRDLELLHRHRNSKIYVRDSGVLHALLGITDYNDLSGRPVVGASWEGFVIENLITAAPDGTRASFYRSAAGAEIDLLREIAGRGLWAIEIKRGVGAKPQRGFHIACDDLQPARRFVVTAGEARYPLTPNLEAISLRELAQELAVG